MAYHYRASVRDLLYRCQYRDEVFAALLQAAREFPNASTGTKRKWHRVAQDVLGRIAQEQVRKTLEV